MMNTHCRLVVDDGYCDGITSRDVITFSDLKALPITSASRFFNDKVCLIGEGVYWRHPKDIFTSSFTAYTYFTVAS